MPTSNDRARDALIAIPNRHRERRHRPARHQAREAIQRHELAPTNGLTFAHQLFLEHGPTFPYRRQTKDQSSEKQEQRTQAY
jgi:hypothetical protein